MLHGIQFTRGQKVVVHVPCSVLRKDVTISCQDKHNLS
jgi:hypothetical protein